MLIISMILSVLILAINPSIVGAGAAVLIVILVWLGQRESQTVNPYYLFLSTPISLLLYSDSVSSIFLPEMSEQVQFVIILGMFSYLAGLLTLRNKALSGVVKEYRNYSFGAFLLIGLMPHLIGIARAGIPFLASDVNLARSAYLAPIIGQFILFLPLTIMVAFKEGSRKKVIISVAVNLISALLLVSKFTVVQFFIFFAFGFVRYQGRKIFPMTRAVAAVLVLVLTPLIFEAVFSMRDTAEQTDFFWRNEIFFGVPLFDEYADYLYLPYTYLTTPWSNFAYIYDVSSKFDYGARSIYGVASFFQLESFLTIEPREIRIPPFNTHAFLSDFYLDFGLFGVVGLSYLLGLLVKQAYVSAIRINDLLSEAIWVTIGFASFLLFFSNHFTNLSYPLVSLLVFSGYRFLSRMFKL